MKPPPRPLDTRPMRSQVYAALRDGLAAGDLRPGEAVSLDAVARSLGVSRTPVREALLRLEVEGFVTIRPRSGISVRIPDAADIRDLYQMIGALEAGVVAAEAERISQELVARLREAGDAMRTALEEGDADGGRAADHALHDALLDLSANRELVGRVKVMRQRLEIVPGAGPRPLEWDLAAADEHDEIIAHLEAGDAAWAAEILRDVHWSPAVQGKWIDLHFRRGRSAEG